MRLVNGLFAKHLIKEPGGKIIFISSILGSMEEHVPEVPGGYYAYRASKAAVNSFAKTLSCDLKPRGVHVGILHPSTVKTGLTEHMGLPEGIMISPEESANGLYDRICALDDSTSGKFIDYKGKALAW